MSEAIDTEDGCELNEGHEEFFKWFKTRARWVLFHAGITSMEDLEAVRDMDLLKLPNCGSGTVSHIRAVQQRLKDYSDADASLETLRDKFAMAALTGILVSPDFKALGRIRDDDGRDYTRIVADMAYENADAMMEARKQ
jgi:hypothetical protein